MQVYTKTTCPYCTYAKKLLTQYKIPYKETMISNSNHRILSSKTGQRTVPYIFLTKTKLLGGFAELKKWVQLEFPLDYYTMHYLFYIFFYNISKANNKNKQKYKSLLYKFLQENILQTTT